MDEESAPGMEPTIRSFGRTRTGFDLLMTDNLNMENVYEMSGGNNEGYDGTDLSMFVQSMNRCLGASKFGLSFEFENLSFQPKGSPKKILDQVSGCIDAGKLWAIMGASGAGKCEYYLLLFLFFESGFDTLTVSRASY